MKVETSEDKIKVTMEESDCPDCEAGNLCGDPMTDDLDVAGPYKMPSRRFQARVRYDALKADFDKLVAYLVREHGIGAKAIKRILEKD